MDPIDLLIQKVNLVDIYRALHNIGAKYLRKLFTFSQNNTRRKGLDRVVPRVESSTCGLHSIRYHGIKLWARLPIKEKLHPALRILKPHWSILRVLNVIVPCLHSCLIVVISHCIMKIVYIRVFQNSDFQTPCCTSLYSKNNFFI